MKKFGLLLLISFGLLQYAPAQTADQLKLVINEIDYDNISTDNAEWLEIVGIINTPLTDILLVFINGATDAVYNTWSLDLLSIPNSSAKVLGSDSNEWDFFVVGVPSISNVDYSPLDWTLDELQNGSPDGILLAYDINNDNVFDNSNDIVINAVAYETGINLATFDQIFSALRTPADNNTSAG